MFTWNFYWIYRIFELVFQKDSTIKRNNNLMILDSKIPSLYYVWLRSLNSEKDWLITLKAMATLSEDLCELRTVSVELESLRHFLNYTIGIFFSSIKPPLVLYLPFQKFDSLSLWSRGVSAVGHKGHMPLMK